MVDTATTDVIGEAAVEATPDQPVTAADRIVTLDFVRGIAVLGILFANITAFGQPFMAYFWPPALVEQPYTAVDEATWIFQLVAVDGKFRGLFTLLFGAGMMLFMERAWARGSSRWLQLRRLFFLMCSGLIHYFFIWRGDILTLYAVWGMIALVTMKWKPTTKWITGLIVTVAGSILTSLMMGMQYAASAIPAIREKMPPEAREQITGAARKTLESAKEEAIRMSGDSYYAIVHNTIFNEADKLGKELVFTGLFETFGLILIGMALYQKGIFSGGIDATKLKIWGWAGIILGTLVTIPIALWPPSQDFPFMLTLFAFNGLSSIPRIAVVLGLLALLAVYAPRLSQGWLGQRFVAAGRAAFTNYLGTSVLMVLIFHGWAGDQFGKHGRLELFMFVVLGWVIMLAWSKPWLEKFRYGPLEWLWRCLTYGKVFPLRR